MPVSTSQAARSGRARRVSTIVCLTLLAGCTCALTNFTYGFEAWTHEARRARQLQEGLLQASPVNLLDSRGVAPRVWGSDVAGHNALPSAFLVDFVYTRCPSVCRTLGSEFQQMQAIIEKKNEGSLVQLASVSFDVEHDRPEALHRYAKSLHADSSIWQFLVPDTKADAAKLLRSLGVVVIPDGTGGFVHNGAIHLLDNRGKLRGIYTLEEWQRALSDARALSGHPRS